LKLSYPPLNNLSPAFNADKSRSSIFNRRFNLSSPRLSWHASRFPSASGYSSAFWPRLKEIFLPSNKIKRKLNYGT
jgi:hypothetical protein